MGRPGRKEGTRERVISPLPYVAVYQASDDVIHRAHLARRAELAAVGMIMKERFQGDGQQNLIDALKGQELVAGDADLANAIVKQGDLFEFPKGDKDDVSSQGTDVAEREANFFAASLLMPREFLAADLAGEDYVDLLDDSFLHELSRKYGVSAQALVNRLKNLGYIQE